MSTDAKRKPGQAGKAILMPDIYADATEDEEPTVEVVVLEEPGQEDDAEGFNPYDTANNLFGK